MKRAVVLGVAAVLVVGLAVGAMWARAPASVRYPDVVDAILARIDGDDDGVVSADEYARVALPDEPMVRYDADRDGELSRQELEDGFLHSSPTAVGRGRLNQSRRDVVPLSR